MAALVGDIIDSIEASAPANPGRDALTSWKDVQEFLSSKTAMESN